MYESVPSGTPEEWHCVNSAGSIIQVDLATRRQIEDWMASLKFPQDAYATLTVDDIYGSEVTLIADAMNHIYDSTPETRRKGRAIERLMRQEKMQQGFADLED